MATSNFTPTLLDNGDFELRAFNDNGGRTVDIQACTRILVALQDPQARRRMSRRLRERGFRVIALDEPVAVWNIVADHASPRLAGFDFVICGGFRSHGNSDACAHATGSRFLLLLGRCGFVPFAADGSPPPAWAFRRAGTGLVPDESTMSISSEPIRRPSGTRRPETAPGHAP